MAQEIDVIIVGSGPTGAQAAHTLVDAGLKVLLVDAGIDNEACELPTGKSFDEIRRTDQEQHRYWLGENFEGIPLHSIGVGSQLPPARKYIMQRVSELTPLISATFSPMESLAKGGLGGAWGLGCHAFSDQEMNRAGLNPEEMKECYARVARTIGISYSPSDIDSYSLGELRESQPAIKIDRNSSLILEQYQRKRSQFNSEGMFLGVPALALLTENLGNREGTHYQNLDFYENEGGAAYRPSLSITALLKKPNFQYLPKTLATHFKEDERGVILYGRSIETNEEVNLKASKLLLCASVLGTARIVLRSQQGFGIRLPLLCNPYVYIPCINWRMLGKVDIERRTSTGQLVLFHDPLRKGDDVAMAGIFSYSSLMLFRIAQQVPLGYQEARKFLQYLSPAFTIAGIHQPDPGRSSNYVTLEQNTSSITGDALHASYHLTDEEVASVRKRERLFMQTLWKLGCIGLKRINPGYGASIHYAGCLPFSKEEKPFHLLPSGRLGMTRRVYVGDGSGFRYLPARGVTFSLMANSVRTALSLAQQE